jgi:hypothetical protein
MLSIALKLGSVARTKQNAFDRADIRKCGEEQVARGACPKLKIPGGRPAGDFELKPRSFDQGRKSLCMRRVNSHWLWFAAVGAVVPVSVAIPPLVGVPPAVLNEALCMSM